MRFLATAGVALTIGAAAALPALAEKTKSAGNPVIEFTIEVRADKKQEKIQVQLLRSDAPKTVEHFVELAKKGFYKGILFHRFEPKFVIQGGDPESKKVDGGKIADLPSAEVGRQFGLGSGGSGSNVPLEAKVSHVRGTLGLARSQDPNSGDSQFFFNLNDNLFLDGKYCAFGKVIKGLDVMDKLRQGDKIISIAPVTEKKKGK